MNSFIWALQKGETEDFRRKFRKLDYLLVDDVQIFGKGRKAQTLSEFEQTICAILDGGGQVVVTLDRPPSDVPSLGRRLLSRFSGGLVLGLAAPDARTRSAIVDQLAKRLGSRLSPKLRVQLAARPVSSVRDLEGWVRQSAHYARVTGKCDDADLMEQVVAPKPISAPKITLDRIREVVAEVRGMAAKALAGRGRSRQLALARHLGMFVAKELTDHSLTEIGQAFGVANHSTVISACRRMREKVDTTPSLQQDLARVKERLSRE